MKQALEVGTSDITTFELVATYAGSAVLTKDFTLNKSYQGEKGEKGEPADYVLIRGDMSFTYPSDSAIPDNTSITLTASLFGDLTTYAWSYYDEDTSDWVSLNDTDNTYTTNYDDAIWGIKNILRIKCESNNGLYDEHTIVKIYSGDIGPEGPEGPQGNSIRILGTVTDVASLPSTGNTIGNIYLVLSEGKDGYYWDGDSWNNIGPIGAEDLYYHAAYADTPDGSGPTFSVEYYTGALYQGILVDNPS